MGVLRPLLLPHLKLQNPIILTWNWGVLASIPQAEVGELILFGYSNFNKVPSLQKLLSTESTISKLCFVNFVLSNWPLYLASGKVGVRYQHCHFFSLLYFTLTIQESQNTRESSNTDKHIELEQSELLAHSSCKQNLFSPPDQVML